MLLYRTRGLPRRHICLLPPSIPQVFFLPLARVQLYDELEDAAPAVPVDGDDPDDMRLTVIGADGKLINPAKWSKADVLEGALNVIQDLRKQLEEERLARTLGVPVGSELP